MKITVSTTKGSTAAAVKISLNLDYSGYGDPSIMLDLGILLAYQRKELAKVFSKAAEDLIAGAED